MRLRRPLPAVQGDTLHIVGVGDNRIGKGLTSAGSDLQAEDIRAALVASMAIVYAQGFDLIDSGQRKFGWHINFSDVAQAWSGGCIIRGNILKIIRSDLIANKKIMPVLQLKTILSILTENSPGWHRTVSGAVSAGIPVPAISSSLAYFDSMRQARSSANLVQAQRDYFGAHTFRRLDREGNFHIDWKQSTGEKA